jgi:hypothetical protein
MLSERLTDWNGNGTRKQGTKTMLIIEQVMGMVVGMMFFIGAISPIIGMLYMERYARNSNKY